MSFSKIECLPIVVNFENGLKQEADMEGMPYPVRVRDEQMYWVRFGHNELTNNHHKLEYYAECEMTPSVSVT
jgi:hypothetical protein